MYKKLDCVYSPSDNLILFYVVKGLLGRAFNLLKTAAVDALFNSVRCARCGEYVMEARARVKDGQPVCIPCSDNYSRGW